MAHAQNVMTTTTPSSNQDNHNEADPHHDRSSPLSPTTSSSSSPGSSSKGGGGGSDTNRAAQHRRLGSRFLLEVLPFRGGGGGATSHHRHSNDDYVPRSGHPEAPSRARRRPRLLTEETWWVMRNPNPLTSVDEPPRTDNANSFPVDDLLKPSNHPSEETRPSQSIPLGGPWHHTRGTRLLGRMRIRSVDRGTDPASYEQHDFPLEYSSEGDDGNDAIDEAVQDSSTSDHEDQVSIASTKLSTLSNISERRVAWQPQAVPPTATMPIPDEPLGMHRHQHQEIVEGGRFQFSSVPLEIFVPTASRDAASNVPEWLRLSSHAQDQPAEPERESDDAFDHSSGEDADVPPPPPPLSPLSTSSSPPRHLLMPRLSPLVTTEPSPSIPRPTLGKHCQSAPVADFYSVQRRPFPPTTPPSSGSSTYVPRPQSLHQIPYPRRRPQSVATGGARDGYRSGTVASTQGAGTRVSSFRSALGGSASMMSTAGASHVSQLSDADKKLLGSRERYQNNSGRFPSGSSVRTLSVGSLVGQSSWVTAPGMTVATSSGSFEPNSRGSPRSRRSALTAEMDDPTSGDRVKDGIDKMGGVERRGSATTRSRRSLLHVGGGDVVSRWMDRGVAWMSATRYLRPQAPSPRVHVATKGSEMASGSPPELQRSSGCLT